MRKAPTMDRVRFSGPMPGGGSRTDGSRPWAFMCGRMATARLSTPSENSVPSREAGVMKISRKRRRRRR